MIPTLVAVLVGLTACTVDMFQNPEGWGCDSHSTHMVFDVKLLPQGFRIPKDGGVIPTREIWRARFNLLLRFRIPKDGGVIPTHCEECGEDREIVEVEFQNPEGWGCDSHDLFEQASKLVSAGFCFRIPKDGGVIPTREPLTLSRRRNLRRRFRIPKDEGVIPTMHHKAKFVLVHEDTEFQNPEG